VLSVVIKWRIAEPALKTLSAEVMSAVSGKGMLED
jgi:hypothetical protein